MLMVLILLISIGISCETIVAGLTEALTVIAFVHGGTNRCRAAVQCLDVAVMSEGAVEAEWHGCGWVRKAESWDTCFSEQRSCICAARTMTILCMS
jgi:hypothetical protein